jgi:hypothetical protein
MKTVKMWILLAGAETAVWIKAVVKKGRKELPVTTLIGKYWK